MKIISYIGIVAILLIACFFFFRGCQQGKALQSIQDSLNIEKALNDTIKIKATKVAQANDSIVVKNTKDSTKYVSKIDSLTRIVQTLKGQFKVTKDSIGTLYVQLKTLYDAHDSIGLARTYYELRDQLNSANQLIFSIQISRDSADNVRNAEIARLNGLVIILQGQLTQYINLLTECTKNADSLSKSGNLAIKQARAGKLFAKIGAGLAALITALLIIK